MPLVERKLFILPELLRSPAVFSGVCVAQALALCEGLCRSLLVLLSFISWSLCCLSFNLRILITSLVSSNSSFKQKLSGRENKYILDRVEKVCHATCLQRPITQGQLLLMNGYCKLHFQEKSVLNNKNVKRYHRIIRCHFFFTFLSTFLCN